MGAGDVGVSSRIKKMVSAYMGRQKVYCDAFEKGDFNMLKHSINDNIYRNIIVKDSKVELLSSHIFFCLNRLNDYKKTQILTANFNLPPFKI